MSDVAYHYSRIVNHPRIRIKGLLPRTEINPWAPDPPINLGKGIFMFPDAYPEQWINSTDFPWVWRLLPVVKTDLNEAQHAMLYEIQVADSAFVLDAGHLAGLNIRLGHDEVSPTYQHRTAEEAITAYWESRVPYGEFIAHRRDMPHALPEVVQQVPAVWEKEVTVCHQQPLLDAWLERLLPDAGWIVDSLVQQVPELRPWAQEFHGFTEGGMCSRIGREGEK